MYLKGGNGIRKGNKGAEFSQSTLCMYEYIPIK
jgi:hypothetical protein